MTDADADARPLPPPPRRSRVQENAAPAHAPAPAPASAPAPNAATARAVVELRDVSKFYGGKRTGVQALDHVSVDVLPGQFTAVMGRSGSGKSTLLRVLAGLEAPTGGSVHVAGTDITRMGDDRLAKVRRDHIGLVFQSDNLVPMMDARSNIALPIRLAGKRPDAAHVDRIAALLGIGDVMGRRPAQLSTAQQQRVAIARALAAKPAVIVADEPAGDLDTDLGDQVLDLLRDAVDTHGQSVLMVTHDVDSATRADRVLVLRDGRVVADLDHPGYDQLIAVQRR